MGYGKNFFIFVFGAAVGSISTYFLIKKKSEDIINDEVESIKKMYEEEMKELHEPKVCNIYNDLSNTIENESKENDILNDEYKKRIKQEGYIDYSSISKSENISDNKNKIQVISPDEFGDNEEYDKVSLIYYSDGVLANENDEEIKNIDEIIGLDSLETFGDFEDDSVHVRNDILKTYYEILRDTREYEELIESKPHPIDSYE